MKWKTCLFGAALVALLASGTAYGNTWANHFTWWYGKDASAVSTYTDTTGTDVRTYGPPAQVALVDYMVQRNGTEAWFNDPPGGGTLRWRFSSLLPASMVGTTGVGAAYKLNIYDDRNFNRGPMQLCITHNGEKDAPRGGTGIPFNCYLLIKSPAVGSYTVQPRRNGGETWGAGINAFTLADPFPADISNSWHVWTLTVIVGNEEVVGTRAAQRYAYWKLYLDGTQILFTGQDDANGTCGQVTIGEGGAVPADTYSFRTYSQAYDSAPFIGLGDLGNDNTQNYGFDWVTYRDDNNAYFDGTPSYTSLAAVSPPPGVDNNSTAIRGQPATPASFDYTVWNAGSTDVSYTVQESDSTGTTLGEQYAWLDVGSADPRGPIAAGGSATVTANLVNTQLLDPGTYTGYFTVSHNCPPNYKTTLRINLTIIPCRMQVDPGFDVYRAVATPKEQPAPIVFNVTNTGSGSFSYTVTKVPDDATTAWLTLDKTGGGPLSYLQADPVTATFNRNGLAEGTYPCQLTFTPTCDSSPNAGAKTLTVYLSVRGAANPKQWFCAEFQDVQGTDFDLATGVYAYPRVYNKLADMTVGANPIPGAIDFYTQGNIDGRLETLKFYYKGGGWARGSFEAGLPLNANYEPAKGMAFTWRLRTGEYYGIGRGPFRVWLPSSDPFLPFTFYFSIHSGNDLRIQAMCCGNPGATVTGVNNIILDQKISDPLSDPNDPESPRIPTYHLWSASGCYDASFNATYSYWNFYLELRDANNQPYMKQIMFTGTNGSVAGPGGKTYSFRTDLKEGTGSGAQAAFDMGEHANSGLETTWDFEFDYVRVLTLDVPGCPFWDGSQGFGAAWPDTDEDGDVDQTDFALLQRCFTGSMSGWPWPGVAPGCERYDRDRDGDLDSLDIAQFENCATGPGVILDETNLPTGCHL